MLETLTREEEESHRYAKDFSEIRRCPECGVYYSYSYSKDEGEHFMDSTWEEVYLTCCSPTWVYGIGSL